MASRSVCVDDNGEPLGLKRLIPEPPEEVGCRELIFRTRFFPSARGRSPGRPSGHRLFQPDVLLQFGGPRHVDSDGGALPYIYSRAKKLVRICRHANSMSKHASRMQENICKVLDNAYASRFVPHRDVVFWLRVYSFFYYQCAWMYFEEGRRSARYFQSCQIGIFCWPCFFRPNLINEPPLFRIRSLIRFNRRAA